MSRRGVEARRRKREVCELARRAEDRLVEKLADEIADELGAELPFETIRYTVRALRLLESRLADPEPVFIPSASP
jgi:hypothetical protein